jgi:phage-related minor tail protein
MPKKEITIEDLAKMVKTGFDETQKDIGSMRNEMKDVRNGMKDVRNEMKNGFKRVNARLDIIEGDIRDFVSRDEYEDLLSRIKLVEKTLGLKI